jgi:hypothetical protein
MNKGSLSQESLPPLAASKIISKDMNKALKQLNDVLCTHTNQY